MPWFDIATQAVSTTISNYESEQATITPKSSMTLTDARYKFIVAWFDDYGYWDTRGIVMDAVDNKMYQSPHCPFSAKEVILYAERFHKESFFISAGGSALSGQSLTQAIFTEKPKVDPLTGEAISAEDRRSLLGGAVYETKKIALMAIGGSIVVGVGYLFLKPFAEKVGNNIAKKAIK